MAKKTQNKPEKGTKPAKSSVDKNDASAAAPKALDPAVLEKLKDIRARVHETFGKIAMAMMAVPRYRHLAIGDLQQLVLEPLMRDRIAMAATPAKDDAASLDPLAGIAIWASVSEAVDAKIREQIKSGTFPVRLKADEWVSGDINWLIDVIAPNQRLATAVIANFKQVTKQGDLRIHPLVTRLVDADALKKMGAAPIGAKAAAGEKVDG